MPTFYITFPFSDAQRRNSYDTVEACDKAAARQIAFRRYSEQWAFLYSQEEFAEQVERFGLQSVRQAPGFKTARMLKKDIDALVEVGWRWDGVNLRPPLVR